MCWVSPQIQQPGLGSPSGSQELQPAPPCGQQGPAPGDRGLLRPPLCLSTRKPGGRWRDVMVWVAGLPLRSVAPPSPGLEERADGGVLFLCLPCLCADCHQAVSARLLYAPLFSQIRMQL